jgi:phage virion morphogenesis protein
VANFVLRLSIQEGDLHRFLRKLNRKLENKVEINKRIGETLVTLTEDRFRTQTDPEGHPWQDLRASTWRRKRRSGGILKILQEQGTLRDKIAYEADGQSVSIGSNLPYAAIHPFGGTIRQRARTGYLNYKLGRDGRPGNRFVKRKSADFQQTVEFGARTIDIPARPYLGLSESYLEEIGNVLGEYLLAD